MSEHQSAQWQRRQDRERMLEEAASRKRAAGEAGNATQDDAGTLVTELKSLMRDFVGERKWQRFHNAKNLSMSLAIEAGELMEHFQWLTTEQVTSGSGFDRAEVADELADVICYAISLANALEIDISQAVRKKMEKNRLKYPAPEPADTDRSSASDSQGSSDA